MTEKRNSLDSLTEANRNRSKFSGHGKALGAAGKKEISANPNNSSFLALPGQSIALSPGTNGFEDIRIGVEWDNVKVKTGNFFNRLLKKTTHQGVDLDLGCLYELEDGSRGAIQAFGDKFGNFKEPPYMALSGDERTGEAPGLDEYILVNGQNWKNIKKILVYIYIYDGGLNWEKIKPQIVIDVPGENDLYVTLSTYEETLSLCAVGSLENVRGGLKLTNHTEYFPGHAEMDRAFGFGLDWKDGKK
ncbi:MAG: TerD family protein [Alphaproteobacteria bacterium]|nr:TerD family protein [Alphaproteobacteria bacterium]